MTRDEPETDMAAKPRETYDIAETAAKCGAALDKLRAEQRPGAKSGRGGKAAVLRAVRDRLQSLSGEDYTTGQVTDALRTVMPSLSVRAVRAALREAAREGTAAKKPRRQKSAREARSGTTRGRDATPMPATAAHSASPSPSPHADPAPGPVQTPPEGPPADPAAPSKPDAASPTAGTAVGLTPEQRAQYRIPEWADGTDLRPGEELEKYARRKRVEGRPKTPDELRKFIGES